jgi:hypothetical protein
MTVHHNTVWVVRIDMELARKSYARADALGFSYAKQAEALKRFEG